MKILERGKCDQFYVTKSLTTALSIKKLLLGGCLWVFLLVPLVKWCFSTQKDVNVDLEAEGRRSSKWAAPIPNPFSRADEAVAIPWRCQNPSKPGFLKPWIAAIPVSTLFSLSSFDHLMMHFFLSPLKSPTVENDSNFCSSWILRIFVVRFEGVESVSGIPNKVAPLGNQAANGKNKLQPVAMEVLGLLDLFCFETG